VSGLPAARVKVVPRRPRRRPSTTWKTNGARRR